MTISKTSTKESIRKLTAHDLAFGIGRKFTDEEISLLIKEHENDEFFTEEEVKESIDKEIAKIQKKKSFASKI